jgi:hypothetical protein
VTFNTVIDAYAKSKIHLPLRRQKHFFIECKQTIKPETWTRNPMSSASTLSSMLGQKVEMPSAKRAEAILDHMQKQYKEGTTDVQPNTVTFNTVIDAYAKSQDPSAPEKAEALLYRMEAEHKAGNMDAKPNVISFNTVINAWAKRGDTDGAQRAEAILFICRSSMMTAFPM